MKRMKNVGMQWLVLSLLAMVCLLNACSDDDSAKAPTADFTYVADGLAVTFTSTSTDATTFSWDFGDGETSTDENPTHTYDAYGTYTVSLYVTGKGGADTSLPDDITLAKSSDVAIDGSFSDWDDVDALSTFAEDGNESYTSMTTLKMDYDASKIYFYVEGTTAMKGYFDVFINIDNDTTTGYASGTYLSFGADYLYEGDLGTDTDAALLNFTGSEQEDFTWGTAAEAGTGFLTNSGMVTSGDTKMIEFAISRSIFSDMSTEAIGVAIMDWKDPDNNEWTYIGALPGQGNRLAYLDLTR